MKTFEDLVFVPHPNASPERDYFWVDKAEQRNLPYVQAKMAFPNGYGVSVIQGPSCYTRNINEFELAVLCGDQLDYSTPITSDVLGYVSCEEVTEAMRQVQELPDAPSN